MFEQGLDDYTNGYWKRFHEELVDSGNVKYLNSQLERCPVSKKLHWQAFVKLISKQRGTWFKRYLPVHCHFQTVTVERAAATGYGMKEESRVEDFLETGTRPLAVDKHEKGGQRTKEQWDEVRKVICANDRTSIPVDLILKYNIESRIARLQKFWTEETRKDIPYWLPNPWGKILLGQDMQKRRHYWIYSRAPNKGKTTKFAEPLENEFRAYIKCGDFSYWNLNGDEQCVILDEFNTAKLKWDCLNSMADGNFEYRIFHGGLLKLRKPLIIILSNQSLAELYPFMNNLLYERYIEIELL